MPTTPNGDRCFDCGRPCTTGQTVHCLTPDGSLLVLCLACAQARGEASDDAPPISGTDEASCA
jgi:hypothetical protein